MRISDWSSDVCSSDLHLRDHDAFAVAAQLFGQGARADEGDVHESGIHVDPARHLDELGDRLVGADHDDGLRCGLANPQQGLRSEEHTSELQSLMRISYAVFCLKKKNTHTNHHK